MKTSRGLLILLLLFVVAFSLATLLQARGPAFTNQSHSGGVMEQLLGDSRRMFSKDFYVKADVSFHSGYYPSIFDQARKAEEEENHMAGSDADEHGEHEEKGGFLGQPTDWIDRIGWHFRVTEHTHLQQGKEREILPWLRISAQLDPHRIEAYTVAAYWLRDTLGKPDEAEQFLREGLRANPDSYEILFELGNLYYQNRQDVSRARNIFELAVRRWQSREANQKEPNFKALHDLATVLAHLEETEGHYARALEWMELAKAHSPNPEAVQLQIDALRSKMPAAIRQDSPTNR